ncbi:MAG: type I 3-dehydroquinate dehydratase [Eubacterium sp.]
MKKIGSAKLGEGMPAVCVPVMGRDFRELKHSLEAAAEVPHDVIELRMDSLEGAQSQGMVRKALSLARDILPQVNLLYTFRTAEEGGEQEILEDRYFTMLEEAVKSGLADAVDIEFYKDCGKIGRLIETARKQKVFVILSSHDFQKTPPREDIINRLITMRDLGADAAKFACMPENETDVFTLMGATAEVKRRFPDQLLITMSMGGTGVLSRIGGETDGSCLTFGCAEKASAPGQINAGELLKILEMVHEAMRIV